MWGLLALAIAGYFLWLADGYQEIGDDISAFVSYIVGILVLTVLGFLVF